MIKLPANFVNKKYLILGVIIASLVPIIYAISLTLTQHEQKPTPVITAPVAEKKPFEGKIVYLGGNLYPDEDISFSLVDPSGKTILLLKSSDAKLEIVEGLTVKLTGKLTKTKNTKEEVLIVDEVIINNGSN